MTKFKWRKKDDDLPEGTMAGDEDAVSALLPTMKELAETMGGEPLAVILGKKAALFVVEMPSGLLVVEGPPGARSLSDLPEEAEHFCTGLELAKHLMSGNFLWPVSGGDRKTVLGALAMLDAKASVKRSVEWIKLRAEFEANNDSPEGTK